MNGPNDGPEKSASLFQQSLQSQREAEEYIAKAGGLPEITAAAEGILSALAQTKQEIETATFASRFKDKPGPLLRAALDSGSSGFDFFTIKAIENEGERGLKRAQLMGSFMGIQNEVTMALAHLVSLRADLVVSQMEFGETVETPGASE